MSEQKDGAIYNYAIGEYEIVINGEVVAYAEQQQRAWDIYNGYLEMSREHVTRNPANTEYTMQDYYGVTR